MADRSEKTWSGSQMELLHPYDNSTSLPRALKVKNNPVCKLVLGIASPKMTIRGQMLLTVIWRKQYHATLLYAPDNPLLKHPLKSKIFQRTAARYPVNFTMIPSDNALRAKLSETL